MSRRWFVPVLTSILMLGSYAPVAAASDAPSRCGQINAVRPVGPWISGTIDSATDVDWYRFAMPEHTLVRVVLGGLPADYRMDVYRECGATQNFHFHDYQPGRQFEELLLSTSTDPWIPAYVRISGVAGAFSSEPYQLRVTVISTALSILSSRSFVDGGDRYIVGEVLGRSSYRNMQVTATLYDSAETVIGTMTAPTMMSRVDWSRYRRRTPFEIAFDPPPGFDHYSLAVSGQIDRGDPVRGLNFTDSGAFVDGAGIGHFPGEVQNTNDFAIDDLDVFVTLYDTRGRVINVSSAATGKEHVGAHGKSTYEATFSHHFERWNRWRSVPQAIVAP